MELYEPNSFKSRQEKKKSEERAKVEKVVSGPVRTKKKSGVSRFLGTFISTDTPDIKTYIVADIVIPTIKEAISSTVNMVLFGDSRRRKSLSDKVSYGKFYNDKRGDRYEDRRRDESSVIKIFDDVIVNSRKDAEMVLSQLDDIIDTYGFARVADLYDLVGMTGDYTANNYGWTNVSDADIVRLRDGGYLIEMPKAKPIK